MTSKKKTFGAMLRELRERRDWTLSQLATKLELSVVYLSDIERGKRQPFTWDRIATAAHELGATREECNQLMALAVETRGQYELDAHHASTSKQELGAALQRNWNELPEETVGKLQAILLAAEKAHKK